jgi:hypothetical protein
VDVRFDETGGQEPTARVDRLARRFGDGADVCDAAVGDRDVDDRVAVGNVCAADDEI